MKPFIKYIFGDKSSPEPEHHEFSFPGGSINVQRTENGEYWAHITVYKGQLLDDIPSQSQRGNIVDSRIDTPGGVFPLPNIEGASHIAVRIERVK